MTLIVHANSRCRPWGGRKPLADCHLSVKTPDGLHEGKETGGRQSAHFLRNEDIGAVSRGREKEEKTAAAASSRVGAR